MADPVTSHAHSVAALVNEYFGQVVVARVGYDPVDECSYDPATIDLDLPKPLWEGYLRTKGLGMFAGAASNTCSHEQKVRLDAAVASLWQEGNFCSRLRTSGKTPKRTEVGSSLLDVLDYLGGEVVGDLQMPSEEVVRVCVYEPLNR